MKKLEQLAMVAAVVVAVPVAGHVEVVQAVGPIRCQYCCSADRC